MNIKQRTAYPLSLKNATLDQYKKTDLSSHKIAKQFNISKSTVGRWASEAGLQRMKQPEGLARHRATVVAARIAKTPTLQSDGSIMLQGKCYTV